MLAGAMPLVTMPLVATPLVTMPNGSVIRTCCWCNAVSYHALSYHTLSYHVPLPHDTHVLAGARARSSAFRFRPYTVSPAASQNDLPVRSKRQAVSSSVKQYQAVSSSVKQCQAVPSSVEQCQVETRLLTKYNKQNKQKIVFKTLSMSTLNEEEGSGSGLLNEKVVLTSEFRRPSRLRMFDSPLLAIRDISSDLCWTSPSNLRSCVSYRTFCCASSARGRTERQRLQGHYSTTTRLVSHLLLRQLSKGVEEYYRLIYRLICRLIPYCSLSVNCTLHILT